MNVFMYSHGIVTPTSVHKERRLYCYIDMSIEDRQPRDMTSLAYDVIYCIVQRILITSTSLLSYGKAIT